MQHIDTRHHAQNEIVRYRFFEKLEHQDGKDSKTIDHYIIAIHEFELAIGFKDFRKFVHEWAITFKNHLNDKKNQRTGEHISKSLYFHYVDHVRHFFEWLQVHEKDYAKLKAQDISYLRVSRNDRNRAKATGYQESHKVEDILATIRAMPSGNELEMRNKAILSLFLLANPRIASLRETRIKSIRYFEDYDAWAFLQDPRLQSTKFAKSITTFFIGDLPDIIRNVTEWRDYLIAKGCKDKDYLFPKITPSFTPSGENILQLSKEPIASDGKIRDVVKVAFHKNGLPYYKPHTFRHSISRKARQAPNATDLLIALSQNFGHKNGMAEIVRSYGCDYLQRQAELVKGFGLE